MTHAPAVGTLVALTHSLPGHSAGNLGDVLAIDPTGVLTVEMAIGGILAVMPGDVRPVADED